MEKPIWVIEFKSPLDRRFSINNTHGFKDKDVPMALAKTHKKSCPEMGVRVVEIDRKIIKVL